MKKKSFIYGIEIKKNKKITANCFRIKFSFYMLKTLKSNSIAQNEMENKLYF